MLKICLRSKVAEFVHKASRQAQSDAILEWRQSSLLQGCIRIIRMHSEGRKKADEFSRAGDSLNR